VKLLEALEKHGKRWNIISGCIKGRPAVQCRNRFLSLQRAGKVSEDGKVTGGVLCAGRSTVSDMTETKREGYRSSRTKWNLTLVMIHASRTTGSPVEMLILD
jgi:hypothetical protein